MIYAADEKGDKKAADAAKFVRGKVMKQIFKNIMKRLTWQKIVIALTVIYYISPYFIGPCFDKEFINRLDANKIRENYTAFDDYEVNDEYVYVSQSDIQGDEYWEVKIYVYGENKFRPRATFWKTWYLKLPFSCNSSTVIKKNSMKIIVTEFTKTPRSKKAQAYLEEVLAQFE